MTNERAKQILCMSEQEAWRSGITLEEHKEAISVAVKALEMKQKRGEWIKTIVVEEPKKNKRSYAKCSCCGVYFKPFSFADREFYFCPKCGSDNRNRRK